MAVSYRFHAYSPQRKDPGRRLRAKARQALVESEATPGHVPEAPLRYGRRFAETEERGHERAEAATEPARPSAAPRGPPIGALPPTEEPIRHPDRLLEETEPPGMEALMSEALRNLEALTTAIRDVGESSLRLARFPWDAARTLRLRRKR